MRAMRRGASSRLGAARARAGKRKTKLQRAERNSLPVSDISRISLAGSEVPPLSWVVSGGGRTLHVPNFRRRVRPMDYACGNTSCGGAFMPGIFISYRRIDTQGWAGHLFADLRKRFGASQVFMDINGGIPRGADFEQVLRGALEECSALLALIGPQWIGCTRPDGKTRRLDIPDDWVRNEISTALSRKIPVVPVLLGGAPLPCKEN